MLKTIMKLFTNNNEEKITRFKYNCSEHKDKITDHFLLTMPHLEILDLRCEECHWNCTKFTITDESIGNLVHLTELNCSRCIDITDASIKKLVNLTKLECYMCHNITDASIKYLTGMVVVHCASCPNITDASIKYLKTWIIF